MARRGGRHVSVSVFRKNPSLGCPPEEFRNGLGKCNHFSITVLESLSGPNITQFLGACMAFLRPGLCLKKRMPEPLGPRLERLMLIFDLENASGCLHRGPDCADYLFSITHTLSHTHTHAHIHPHTHTLISTPIRFSYGKLMLF